VTEQTQVHASNNAANPLRILLADDHAMMRDGLAMLINSQTDMQVIAEAANGREAVDRAVEDHPDIAVLDVSMPECGGAEAAVQIHERCPGVRLLALTRHGEQGYLRRMLQAGATGYVLKKSAGDKLIQAIRTIASGHTYIDTSLASAFLDGAFGQIGKRSGRPSALSVREEEVLRLIAWGLGNTEIAAQLHLSVKTIESYKATATEKLGLRSRTEIVQYALACGWLLDDRAPDTPD